jgi:acetyl-CoA carboxylase biotin carboxyl carrier protein
MNIKEIQDLIKFVAKAGVTEVEIEQKDFKITIKAAQETERQILVQAAPMQQVATPAPVAMPAAAPAAPVATPATPAEEDNSNLITIKSPMIGTFYRASGPDKDPFVTVGQTISTGDTICIIEAMKLFNEIEAEISGKIVKVLVDDATPVEYDQPLFLVEPSK